MRETKSVPQRRRSRGHSPCPLGRVREAGRTTVVAAPSAAQPQTLAAETTVVARAVVPALLLAEVLVLVEASAEALVPVQGLVGPAPLATPPQEACSPGGRALRA